MPETQVNRVSTADLALDLPAFTRECERLNLTSDSKVAAAFGVDRLTVWRVRTGQMGAGGRFIGGALRALRGVRFEDLFLVVDYVPRRAKKDL